MEFIHYLNNIFQEVFSNGLFGIPLFQLLIIIFLLFVSIFTRKIFANFIIARIKNLVIKSGNRIDDALFKNLVPPLKLLPILFIFILFSLYTEENSSFSIFIKKINLTLATIFIFWIVHQSFNVFHFIFKKLEVLLTKSLVIWISNALKYLLIFLGVAAVLDIWGIKIGPVIAGLGLFGVAVALGAQDLFKNLISGVMIILEKRFNIGDVINVQNYTEGTVEHIGFRSTLIRKFDSTPITIPNHIFAEVPIVNFSQRNYRRINWIIGLEYNTSLDQITKILNSIELYINENKDFIIDDNHKLFVRLDKFNDSSIDILIYCFVNTNDWSEYLKIKEELAFRLKKIIEENKASFAFPSQSIYIEKNEK